MAEADCDVNQVFEAEPRVADYVVNADVHVTPPPPFWPSTSRRSRATEELD